MDYSKLSDFEINKRVAACLGAKPYMAKDFEKELSGESVIIKSNFKLGAFEPCNNPADAWPIIQENGISIVRDYDEWMALAGVESRHGEADHFSHCYQGSPTKPLRSGMIVYLMMRESE